MVRILGPTKRGPGMIRPLLAETPEYGLDLVLSELEEFYRTHNDPRGRPLKFERAQSGPVSPKTRENRVNYRRDGSLYARVNVRYLRPERDSCPPPAAMQQDFSIWFYVDNKRDKARAKQLSEQERNDFLDYAERNQNA